MRRPRTSLLAALTLSVWANVAEAKTTTVTTTAELRAAIGAAKAGDEIVLADGTYAVDSKIACSAAGTKAAPIVVRAATPHKATIESTTLEAFAVTGPYWTFEDLTVRGKCADDEDCEHAFHVTGHATGFTLRHDVLVDFNAQLKVNAAKIGDAHVAPDQGLIEYNEVYDTHVRDTTTPVTKLNIDTGDAWIVRGNFIHDFFRPSAATYGAFMKSGGTNGRFERNLVVCKKDLTSASGTQIGLSFGGGGTAPEFCAPAFKKDVACEVEHEGGTLVNNIIANCSDVGIYLNRAKSTKVLFNTLIGTTGIDFRFATTSGEARGNVVSGPIRQRNGAGAPTLANNLLDVSQAQFDAFYVAPLAGDLRKKGDLSPLLGQGGPVTDVTTDYCLRARAGTMDLGALQASLGDCETTTPHEPSGGEDGGTGGPDGGAPGGPGAPDTPGDGAPLPGDGAAATAGDEDDGGCRTTGAPRPGGGASALALAALVASVVIRRRRADRRSRP